VRNFLSNFERIGVEKAKLGFLHDLSNRYAETFLPNWALDDAPQNGTKIRSRPNRGLVGKALGL
jgi:hypothetical protein